MCFRVHLISCLLAVTAALLVSPKVTLSQSLRSDSVFLGNGEFIRALNNVEVVVSNGVACGFYDARWLPGSLVRQKFQLYTYQQLKVRRAIRRASGIERRQLQRKQNRLKDLFDEGSRACLLLGAPLPIVTVPNQVTEPTLDSIPALE